MASNRCLQADTALNQNSLIRSLNNELGRRLDSFSKSVADEERILVLDKFTQKMINSDESSPEHPGEWNQGAQEESSQECGPEHPSEQECRTECSS